MAGKLLPKVGFAAFEERGRDDGLRGNVGKLYAIAAFARQNQEFANHVLARKVDARIGFAVTVFLCHAYGLAKGNVGTKSVEHIVQRAAQYGFEAQYAVARGQEVADGADDGKPRADVRFK